MTEGKKIGQWIVGMVLLFLFLVTAFIPWITLSGNDYVDAAVNVHEYARKQDAVTADAAGAFTFISNYQKDSELRNAWVASYEKEMKSFFNAAPYDIAVKNYPIEKVTWFVVNETEGAALSNEEDYEKIIQTLKQKYPHQ